MKNADYILLHFTDLLGSLKGRTISAEEAENAIREGVGFDGSSIIGGVSIEESDMIMKPDASTFAVCPQYFYNKASTIKRLQTSFATFIDQTEKDLKATQDTFVKKAPKKSGQKDTTQQPPLN